jgi:hypothetical protein
MVFLLMIFINVVAFVAIMIDETGQSNSSVLLFFTVLVMDVVSLVMWFIAKSTKTR